MSPTRRSNRPVCCSMRTDGFRAVRVSRNWTDMRQRSHGAGSYMGMSVSVRKACLRGTNGFSERFYRRTLPGTECDRCGGTSYPGSVFPSEKACSTTVRGRIKYVGISPRVFIAESGGAEENDGPVSFVGFVKWRLSPVSFLKRYGKRTCSQLPDTAEGRSFLFRRR